MKKLSLKEKTEHPYKVTTVSKAVKDVDLQKRTVTGMFSSCYFIDSDLDMILPGASSKSIQERGPSSTKGNRIKHLKDHDWSKNIARLDVIDERSVDINGREVKGLYHESFYPESTDSNDQLIKIQSGLYDSRSIGFQYVNIELLEKGSEDFDKFLTMAINPEVGEEAGYFWVVKEYKLWEGSDVSFGANELTPLLGIKSKGSQSVIQKQLFDKLDICKSLMKKGGLTDEGFHTLEMEMLQIKAYISNIASSQPTLKDTNLSSHRLKDTDHSSKNFLKSILTH